MKSQLFKSAGITGAALLFAATFVTSGGCDRKDKVIDVKTPAADVEVERDRDTGDTDVNVDRNP
jgi:hypothetical protein